MARCADGRGGGSWWARRPRYRILDGVEQFTTQQAGETAGTEDEADVLLGPFFISEDERNIRTEAGLYSREKEIDAVEAAQARAGRRGLYSVQ